MTDSIAVIALDAADHRLAREWDCENILLDTHRRLETDSHANEFPLTTEVWPAVATGWDVSAFSDVEQEWTNPVLRAGSRVTQVLPSKLRWALGVPFRARGAESYFESHDSETPFDAVRHWPGVTEAKHLDEAWMWLNQFERGRLSTEEFLANLRANTGEEFGWVASVASPSRPVSGVHSHILDMTGHMYAERPATLREHYEWTDRQLGWVRESVDELVVLSDHGMQTSLCGDEQPGEHSWRALVAATDGIDAPLPRSIYDVASWLDRVRPAPERVEYEQGLDTTKEHLQELGYLS